MKDSQAERIADALELIASIMLDQHKKAKEKSGE